MLRSIESVLVRILRPTAPAAAPVAAPVVDASTTRFANTTEVIPDGVTTWQSRVQVCV